jgi:hypothetical protein
MLQSAKMVSALCLLLSVGSAAWAVQGERRDESQRQLADNLTRLHKAAQVWLARDLPDDKLATNRAYTDLIFAFGLARVGEAAASGRLLRSSADTLGRGDEVHRCLLRTFTYRIDQALAGRPHAGPLPAEVFAPLAQAAEGSDRLYGPVLHNTAYRLSPTHAASGLPLWTDAGSRGLSTSSGARCSSGFSRINADSYSRIAAASDWYLPTIRQRPSR